MMVNVDEAKLTLMDALLAQSGLKRMLDVSASLLGNLLFVADRGLNVIARSGSETIPASLWPADWCFSLPQVAPPTRSWPSACPEARS